MCDSARFIAGASFPEVGCEGFGSFSGYMCARWAVRASTPNFISGGWRRVFCELGGKGFANKVMLRGGDGVFASLMIAF